MTILFSVKSSFYCCFIRTLLGAGGGLEMQYVLYTPENDEKSGLTLVNF